MDNMEKRGVVEPGRTPDNDSEEATKKATDKVGQTEALDDDFTKRAADAASVKLKT